MTYNCKRCNGPLKEKTYTKWFGYSAYCWKKHCEETIQENKKIVKEINNSGEDATVASFPLDETYLEIIDLEYYLEKTKIHLPKIYYKKEYCKIYAIKEKDQQDKYYNKYLDKLKTLTENLHENWLPTNTLNNYTALALAT